MVEATRKVLMPATAGIQEVQVQNNLDSGMRWNDEIVIRVRGNISKPGLRLSVGLFAAVCRPYHRYGVLCGLIVISTGQEVSGDVST